MLLWVEIRKLLPLLYILFWPLGKDVFFELAVVVYFVPHFCKWRNFFHFLIMGDDNILMQNQVFDSLAVSVQEPCTVLYLNKQFFEGICLQIILYY